MWDFDFGYYIGFTKTQINTSDSIINSSLFAKQLTHLLFSILISTRNSMRYNNHEDLLYLSFVLKNSLFSEVYYF